MAKEPSKTSWIFTQGRIKSKLILGTTSANSIDGATLLGITSACYYTTAKDTETKKCSEKDLTHTQKKEISLIRIQILISFAQEKLELSSIISYRKENRANTWTQS